MAKFNVTFERITPESAGHGDLESTGFLAESVGLREAIELANIGHAEPDSSPLSLSCPPRWIKFYGDMNPRDGSNTNHAIHFPHNTTPASAMRLARLLGV